MRYFGRLALFRHYKANLSVSCSGCRADERVIEQRGQRLIVDPTELSGYYLYYEQAYDREVFDFLETVMSDYSRVLDVGAKIGVYTVFFAARVPPVDAFEPVREVVPRLTENIALNRFSNVALHEVCVSGDDGTVQ